MTHPFPRLLAGTAVAVLSLAGCGEGTPRAADDAESSSDAPTTDATPSPAPAADPGPECVGDPDATGGYRVLRGGDVELPDGGTVSYVYADDATAEADGSTRNAFLVQDGDHDNPGTLALDGPLTTEGGDTYTVTQICAYRVVLTPDDPALAPDPTRNEDDMTDWPHAPGGVWKLRWHVPDHQPGDDGVSVVVQEVRDDPPRADISATGRVGSAAYRDVRVGETVEIAGQLWKVTEIDAGNMIEDMSSSEFKPGWLRLERTREQ